MTRTLLTLVIALFASAVHAADWPQFLGPNRDNVSSEKVEAWTGEPKVAWKHALGFAHSSPVVANGVVYAFFQPKGQDADALAAYDAKTGTEKWVKSYMREAFAPPFGKGPRSTPVVADGRVFTLGGTGILACWDAKTGEVKWKVDTLKAFDASNLFFGISMSPIVEGNTVVAMVGGKRAGLVGFDVEKGTVAWKVTDDAASYASPVAHGKGEQREIVFLTGSHLRAISLAGKERWAVPFKDKLNESSTSPVIVNDLVIGSSVTAGSIAVRLTTSGDTVSPTKVWEKKALTCYFSTPVVVGKYAYMVNGAATLLNASITLRCVEIETGKVLWEKTKVGRYHAAIIRTANDKLLMLDDNGNLILLEPSEKEYKELCRSKVCGPTWSHPALVDGRLFLRDENELLAIDLPK